MTKDQHTYYKFIGINNHMNDGYVETVLRNVLLKREVLSKKVNEKYKDVINEHVHIQGFRKEKIYNAKLDVLLPQLIEGFKKRNEITGIMLQAWVDINSNLEQAVIDFLGQKSDITLSEINWRVGFRSAWSANEMEKYAKEFLDTNPSFSYDDVCLMLCIQIGCMPIEPAMMVEARKDQKNKLLERDEDIEKQNDNNILSLIGWKIVLEQLENLPPNAQVWDHIDELINDLRQLAAIKVGSRRIYHIKVEKLIKEIKDQAEEVLAYFEFKGIQTWDPNQLTSDEAETLAIILEDFKSLLLGYQNLRNQETSTLAETKAKRQDLEKLETELQSVYQKLQAGFYKPKSELVEYETQISSQELNGLENISPSMPQDQKEDQDDNPIADQPESISQPQLKDSKDETIPDKQTETENESAPISDTTGLLISREELSHTKQADSTQNLLQDIPTNNTFPIDTEEGWKEFVWKLIYEGNISLAYWVVKSKESSGEKHPVPSWLLEALKGSDSLENEYQSIVSNLLELSNNEITDTDNKNSLSMLLIAASIKPAIIAPYSGLSAWLHELRMAESLDKVITATLKFTENGITLHAEDIEGVDGVSSTGKALQTVVQNAQDWLLNAPSRKFKILRASAVWRHLVKPGGELYLMLKSVIDNKHSELENVQNQVEFWRQKCNVSEKIDKIDSLLAKLKPRPIVGAPKGQLESHIEEACEIASQWCHYVKHEKEIASRGNWLFAQVNNLRQELSKSLPQSVTDLSDFSGDTQRLDIRAASAYLKRTLTKLAQFLKIDVFQENNAVQTRVIILKAQSSSIIEDLKQQLVLIPEIDLNNNLEPISMKDVLRSILNYRELNPDYRAIYQKYLTKQDYRFLNMFEGLIEGDPLVLAREHINSSQAHLRDLKQHVQNEIEQSVVDGIITDAERASHSDLCDQIDPEAVQNFPYHYETLNNVSTKIRIARSNRLEDLTNIWHEILPSINSSNSISQANKEKNITVVEQLIEKSDTRLLEEYIARAKSVLDEFTDWEEANDKGALEKNSLDDFYQAHQLIDRSLTINQRLENIARQIKEGTYKDLRQVGSTPLPRREEAEHAIKAWRQLKSLKNERKSPSTKVLLTTLLSYLGFIFDTKNNDPIQLETGEDSLIARVLMSDSEQAKPIHHFGSRADGKYQIICLWERPGNETISSRIKQFRLKNDNVIVFYLGRLSIKQRDSLIKLNYDEKFNLIILDEILLIYLAQERDSRLNTFLRCAVPFSSINPYTPFQAGDVPPEMFYGRRDMIYALQQQTGACIVYGGRQLGKSALLKQVEREFHNPAQEQYAKVLDIKQFGDPETQTPTEGIWKKIRQTFKELGLFSTEIRTNRDEEIEKHIRKTFSDNKHRRVLILFDEADNFLDADSKENFKITERLRILMVETNRKFKVVFAGLHNVQRFIGNPNQPLAHFGSPLLIGPLDPKSAINLIQEPMQFLGYQFDNITGPLRILTFTNYHPGLIQLFCEELLERIRSNKPAKSPPYTITQNDIEVVYRQVKDKIKERFDWTLALDPAYQGIAWSMIYDQISIRDSYSHAYSPGDLLIKVRTFLPKRFNAITLENFKTLLHEMKGLYVLAKDNNGSYRLRSPNVVRLTGSESDVETKLLELMESSPAIRSSDFFHSIVDEHIYSPFNFQQERRLYSFDSGVSLLFGGNVLYDQKNVLGLPIISYLIEKMVTSNEPDSFQTYLEVPLYISNGDDLKAWLDKILDKNHSLIYVYYNLGYCSTEEMNSLIEGAISYVQTLEKTRYKKNEKNIRFFFGFSPVAMKKWLEQNPSQRKALENKTEVFHPLLWNFDGISHRLEMEQMLHRDDICMKILEVTGGMYLLINIIFDRLRSKRGGIKDDPRDEVDQLRTELAAKSSSISKSIIDDIGIEDYPLAKQILQYIVENSEGSVQREYVSPELMSFNNKYSIVDFQVALEYLINLNCVAEEIDAQGSEIITVNPLLKKVI